MNCFAVFVKEHRKFFQLTQKDLALKAGVGLRFIRELEHGKEGIRLDKINAVLALFGHQAGPVEITREIEP
jgi:y4mF family transcriptional regulator